MKIVTLNGLKWIETTEDELKSKYRKKGDSKYRWFTRHINNKGNFIKCKGWGCDCSTSYMRI